jgi:hypothetical protein
MTRDRDRDYEERAAILVPPKGKHTTVGDFSFDVVEQEQLSTTVTSSKYPREDGSNATDHAYNDPDSISIAGLITDTPGGKGDAEPGRAQELFDKLMILKRECTPVSASVELRDYASVLITSVDAIQDAKTGYSIPVNITIEEVEVADQQFVDIPPEVMAEEVKHSANDRTDGGKKPTKKPSEETEKEGSILYKGGKGLGFW